MHTYDPGQHFISFAGIPLTGIADGTYVTVEYLNDEYTSQAGAGGEVTLNRNRDERGSMKVVLIAGSADNDALSAIAIANKLLGTGIGVFQIIDGNGTTVVHATNAWIKKRPSTEFAKESPNREWMFECEKLELFVGGNR